MNRLTRQVAQLCLLLAFLLTSACGPIGVAVGTETTKKIVEKARVLIWTTPEDDVSPGHPGCCSWSGTYPCGAKHCCRRCHVRCGF